MEQEIKKGGWKEFRKIFFQEDLPPQDIQDVLMAANLLELPEFEIFRLSYAYWYGEKPTEDQVEKAYIPYMFGGKVPLFVRQFSRKVKDMEMKDEIDPAELGVVQKSSVIRNLRMGLLIFTLLFAVQVLVYTMAAYTAGESPLLVGRCFLPPCY